MAQIHCKYHPKIGESAVVGEKLEIEFGATVPGPSGYRIRLVQAG